MSEGESDQFSLRWNNFHSNLTSGFHALLQGEDLVDVTLAAGGQFVQAHKIVLSVCSPYFKDLFKVNPCKHPIVILKDVCHKDLVAILQFMYRGEVNVRQEELATFLKTAEMLQIKGLTGEDSPIEEDITPVPQPSVRTRAPRRVSEKSLHGTPEKKETVANPVTAEPEEASAPPYKRMKPEVSSAVLSSPVITEESSGVEFIEMTNPKQEPVEYETEIEEVNRLQNRDDPLVQLLGGESSQTLQDSSQGSSIFASIPSASQDSGLPQDCGQVLLESWTEEPVKREDMMKENTNGSVEQMDHLAGLSSTPRRFQFDPWRDVLIRLPGKKEKDCCVCNRRADGRRRRSRTVCAKCERGLHWICFPLHRCYM
ncbi:hypothetical protein B7P43_G05151 [Cryptotermes secundus]|uniref:BTB domain-containing protein n=1 Tax=Cryptotermes secundus TaxID=105785 RepID=A0A2J7PEU0_9NEOP|nr:modifier of mdg4 isoform X3 [Cryptotermes secundus]PNF14860.1 hypothetical protein B7P43_G05151 [Cryptotermes secundus]